MHRGRFRNETSLHLHDSSIASGHDGWLVHRLNHRGADLELARIDNFEQVDVLVPLGEVGLEDGSAIVVELAPRKPILPPGRTLPQLVKIVACDEFGAGRDGIFHEEITPFAATNGDAHGENVANVKIALKWIEIVNNFSIVLLGREAKIIARDVERELVVLD